MQLLCRQQREPGSAQPQIETRLRAEDRQRAGASAVVARLTFFQDEPEKIVILPHAKEYRAGGVRQNKKL